MLAVCAAGRILNPKSARSQVIGAMTMGAGATASTAMTHIAIAEALDGKTVDWMEEASAEQYRS